MSELTQIQSILRLRRLERVEQWATAPFTVRHSVASHSYYVALLAQAIAEDLLLDGVTGYAAVNAVVKVALLHDAAECITGDIPHAVKHGNGKSVEDLFKELEQQAWKTVLSEPDCALLASSIEGSTIHSIVKAADVIELGLTATEEISRGNREPECWEVLQTVCNLLEKHRALGSPLVMDFLEMFRQFISATSGRDT